ncbi:MAG: hypothetical protein AB7E47_12835 [Desulfovibrionaceae bacterium]
MNTFLDTVAANLAATFPGLGECVVHGGQFTVEELGTHIAKAPAMRVAMWEISQIVEDPGGERDITLRCSVAVIAKDGKVQGEDGWRKLARHEAANNLVKALCLHLVGQQWGDADHYFAPEGIRARNLYGGKTNSATVQMWEVTWSQTIRTGADLWAEGARPEQIYGSWSPDIGAEHEADYVRIAQAPAEADDA